MLSNGVLMISICFHGFPLKRFPVKPFIRNAYESGGGGGGEGSEALGVVAHGRRRCQGLYPEGAAGLRT